MMRRTPAAAALFVLMLTLGLGSAARADGINLLTVQSYNITSALNVTLFGRNLGNEYGAEFLVRMDLGNNNFTDVIAYCVDIYQGIGRNSYTGYNLYAVDSSPAAQAAAWLLGHFDPLLNNQPTNLNTVTALQAAIWEVTYDTPTSGFPSRYSLTSGNLVYNNLSSSISNLANSYLAALSLAINAGTVANTGLNLSGVARSNTYQDLIVGNVNAVPEPGSMVLFGSAAGLLGWWRRRQAKREAEQG